EVIRKINQNLQECIEEFRTIIFEKVSLSPEHKLRKIYGDKTFKRIGVLDKYGQKYWADELSDGTLYFLALLATIHQPNPPKLLLLEEPENGIHPRRIKEVVDFIFELAESKGVQVIMTTHSTVLIDQFEDLPENIFVFDKNTTYTTIKNLQSDIIAEDKQQSEKLNLPQLDLSGSLGDHWASGLIGGVPK
ncbi:MAG: ATP-binding protein, partial [Bacteroidota bacterium]